MIKKRVLIFSSGFFKTGIYFSFLFGLYLPLLSTFFSCSNEIINL
jgi:hypothetical protein